MIFSCKFENRETGAQKRLICRLDAGEIAEVARARRRGGEEVAQATAAAIVLKSAYAEIDPLDWHHMSPPEPVN